MSMPLPTLIPGGAEELDTLLKATVEKREVPAIFYSASNAKETFYENQDGDRVFGDESAGKINRDTTLELYSMTKLVVSVSVLLLVEKGLVSLDSEEDIEKHLPELATLPILKGFDGEEPILVPAKNKITLRMLLTHTSGLSYMNRSEDLIKWNKTQPKSLGNMLEPKATIQTITFPLVFEPGTSWTYSTGIDWAGVLVERISGQKLDTHFREHIFNKLDGKAPDMTFYPRDDIKSRKMGMCARGSDGKIVAINAFGMGRPEDPDLIGFNAGGAGLFGTIKDYMSLLRAILTSDPRYKSSDPLLSPASYAQLFKGNLGGNLAGKESVAEMMKGGNYYDPVPYADTVDHSIALSITTIDLNNGRKAGTGCWSGAARSQYWLDPATGLAGIVATQLLGAPNPDPWNHVYQSYEKTLYKNLQ